MKSASGPASSARSEQSHRMQHGDEDGRLHRHPSDTVGDARPEFSVEEVAVSRFDEMECDEHRECESRSSPRGKERECFVHNVSQKVRISRMRRQIYLRFFAERPIFGAVKDTKSRAQKQTHVCFCRDGVSTVQAKVRKVERRSKRMFDSVGAKCLRCSQRVVFSATRSLRSSEMASEWHSLWIYAPCNFLNTLPL